MVRSNQPDPVIDVEHICESYNLAEKMRIYRSIFPKKEQMGGFSSEISETIESLGLPSEFAADADRFARSYLVKRLGLTLTADEADGIDGVHSGLGSIVANKLAEAMQDDLTASYIIDAIGQQVEAVFQQELVAQTKNGAAR